MKRQNLMYIPSLIGDASFFPTGTLADKMIQTGIGQFEADGCVLNVEVQSDLQFDSAAVGAVS
jgi:hypothetical protein